MKRTLICFLISVILIINCLPVLASTSADRVILYVSPTGYDFNDGSVSNPLASITGARNRIRLLRENGANPQKGFVVYLREGIYYVSDGIELTEEDSGTEAAPVIYRAYPGEKAVLTGARTIDKAHIQKAGTDITDRIVSEAARDKIYSVKLSDVGITNAGVQTWYGAYSYPQSYIDRGYAVRTNTPPIEFISGDKMLSVARYPNDGYIKIKAVIDEGWHSEKNNGKEVGAPFLISVDDTRITKWGETAQKTALMYGFWQYDWADQTVPIQSIDAKKLTIQSRLGSVYSVGAGSHFYVYNLLEEIDTPGEYYIDRINGIMYFYAPDTSNLELRVVDATDNLITMNNASFVYIKDIVFDGSRKKAIDISGGEGNKIEGCEIRNTSELAVDIKSPKSGISNSFIHDVEGGIGVYGGSFPTLTHGEIYVLNCEIKDYSRISKTNKSAVSLGGVGNIVAFNEIHSAPHQAISYSGNDHKIYYNNIYDVVKETDDAAAIYGGLDWVGRGHEIYYNYIHDINYTDYTTDFAGVCAIYMDGGQCELYIKGNVIENVEGVAFWVNSGQDNRITNNIVINDDIRVGSGWRNRWGLWLTDVMKNADFSQNHCPKYRQAKSYITNDVWRSRYGNTLLDMIENQTNQEVRMPKNNIYKDNVLVNTQLVQYRQSGTEIEDTIDVTKNYVSDISPFDDAYNLSDSNVLNVIPEFKNVPYERMGRSTGRAQEKISNSVVLAVDSPYAFVNGTKKLISQDGEQTVSVVNSRSYVSLDFLAESLSLNLISDGEKILLSNEKATLSLTPDLLSAELNGEPITLTDAVISDENGTLIAPLGDIAKIFGKEIFWHNRGFVSISDNKMFDANADIEIIIYLHDKLNVY